MKNNIRELRKQLGVRQEDIANTLGVTRQTINAIENEKYIRKIKKADRLSEYDEAVASLFLEQEVLESRE